MTAVHERLLTPWPGGVPFAVPAVNNLSFDDSGDGFAHVLQAPKTGNITKIYFRYGLRTGTPPRYLGSIQGVSATTGLPDGTVLGGGTPASVSIQPPATTAWDGTGQWLTLNNALAVTRGDFIATCLEYDSVVADTIDASNFSSWTQIFTNAGVVANDPAFPYRCIKAAGTWSKPSGNKCLFGVTYDDGSVHGILGKQSVTVEAAATSGHRAAAKFTVPTDLCSTFKIASIQIFGRPSRAVGLAPSLKIWDTGGTVQQTLALDTDIVGSGTSTYLHSLTPTTDGPPALSAGTTYYAGFESAGGANSQVLINGLEYQAAGDLAAFDFADWICSSYNGATWTDYATYRPLFALVLEDVTQAAGGGGLLVGGYMSGGMR